MPLDVVVLVVLVLAVLVWRAVACVRRRKQSI